MLGLLFGIFLCSVVFIGICIIWAIFISFVMTLLEK